MNDRMTWMLLVTAVLSGTAAAAELDDPATAVAAVLDTFHEAASRADGDLYFDLFADDAVFLGTDASERWTVDEFRAFAEPYFSTGRGWTYTKKDRHVFIAADGATAWFDELLWNDTYGTCRGTGVLLLVGSGWRIAQYNLTIPIPNELATEIVAMITAGNEQ
jgi:ketosteroid isomerase-like protein